MTLVGDAGIGKSRLALEALASIGVPVVRGPCLPYGEAITYWPVVEALRQRSSSRLPMRRPRRRSARCARREGRRQRPTRSAGRSGRRWSMPRRRRRSSSSSTNIHWVEEALLDLVEYVALPSSGAAWRDPNCSSAPPPGR